MVSSRRASLAVLAALLAAHGTLGARVEVGNKARCSVTERPFTSSNGFDSYGVSYNLVVQGCASCNLHRLKDLSSILNGKLEGTNVCKCWGKVAGQVDAWNEFYSFKKLSSETCGWEKCWELYGGKLLKKRKNHVTSKSATDSFFSMNHWQTNCVEAEDAEGSFEGPSVGEVIAIITDNNAAEGEEDGDGDKEDPIKDLGPIFVPEMQMKDDDGPLSDEEDLDDLDDLEEEDEDPLDEDVVKDVEPKTCEECKERQAAGENHACGPPLCPEEDVVEDVEPKTCEECKERQAAGENHACGPPLCPEEDSKPAVDEVAEKKPAVKPAGCQKTTPPDACRCIQQQEAEKWKRGQFSETAAEIGKCMCNLENDEDGWVTPAGKIKCMGRTMAAMRELGGFACKLQKYNNLGDKQRCHPTYHGKDITGAEARATFD